MDKDINELDKVTVPDGLKDRQIKLAKQYVIDKQTKDGFNITGFCKDNNLSTKTWYAWQDDFKFTKYIQDLQGEFITDDERKAFAMVKRKIMQMATSKNASLKEIELFLEMHSYLVEADKLETMQKLGINPNQKQSGIDTRTVDQKKQLLLNRLKG